MRLVLFDFDGTLTRRDTLMPFLLHAVGARKFALGLLSMSPVLVVYAMGLMRNDVAKQRLLAHFLGGKTLTELRVLGQEFVERRLPALLRPSMLEALERHRRCGDVCLLVSASLDIYLEPWARQHAITAVLCSRLATDSEGRVSGRLDDGNCFGPVKVQRVREWLGDRLPVHITAYGDSRGDNEMMAFANVAHWVGSAA